MLRKSFFVLIVIATAFHASVMALGEELGGGIEIDGNTLKVLLLKNYHVTANFITDNRGGAILKDTGEPIFTDSNEIEGESKLKIYLPVPGDEILECKPDLELPLCGYKILKIELFTQDNLNFDITAELSKICLNEFPQLDKNSYDIKEGDKELVGTIPQSPTKEYSVNFDKPINISSYGEIKSLSWISTTPNYAKFRESEPIIFIPLCDKNGNQPPCKIDKVKLLMANWDEENLCKVTTWFEIMLGQQEEDVKDLSNPKQDESSPCVQCDKIVVSEIIYPPKCLNSNQITTWEKIIKGETEITKGE